MYLYIRSRRQRLQLFPTVSPVIGCGVDTSTPNGRLVFGIFGSIAEVERELIRDRIRSGIALAKSRGKQLGRQREWNGQRSYGYSRTMAPRRVRQPRCIGKAFSLVLH